MQRTTRIVQWSVKVMQEVTSVLKACLATASGATTTPQQVSGVLSSHRNLDHHFCGHYRSGKAAIMLGARDIVLNATLVNTALDFEETIITPLGRPRILHKPVGLTVLSPPAKCRNCVPAQHAAMSVGVHTALVSWEVGVH